MSFYTYEGSTINELHAGESKSVAYFPCTTLLFPFVKVVIIGIVS